MKTIMALIIFVVFFVLVGLVISKIEVVCLPAKAHPLNERLYKVLHTDTVSTEPMVVLRQYYMKK